VPSTEPPEAEREERPTTRRELLERAGAAGAAALGALAFDRLGDQEGAPDQPVVAIIGAGLAGLTCAYRLGQAGLHADVYEATTRVGGRCRTVRDAFDDGAPVEAGGELIAQDHADIRVLAGELGLELEELQGEGAEPLLFVGGAPYPAADAARDLGRIEQTPEDDVSAAAWIERAVPGGGASRAGRLLAVACAFEFGADPDDQSALNLPDLLDGVDEDGRLSLAWGGSERVAGGNDGLATNLTVLLGSHLHTGYRLVALERLPDGGRYTLTLSQQAGGTTSSVTADHVVLALPFSSLRSVDWTHAGFDPRKAAAIRELGTGTHSKLHLRFSTLHWRELGLSGRTLSDTGYQATWEAAPATLAQCRSGHHPGPAVVEAERLLRQAEAVLPGLSGAWDGRAAVHPWPEGSRAYRRVGQHSFAGIEGERQGNCHFAGEHTSLDFPGTLNGAVESGERVAWEILDELG
jgi:monoamine oxidase